MGGWVVVVERGGKDIRDFDFPTGCALVLGSEGEGVSKSLMEIADAVVSIPMVGKINSLNVSLGVSTIMILLCHHPAVHHLYYTLCEKFILCRGYNAFLSKFIVGQGLTYGLEPYSICGHASVCY